MTDERKIYIQQKQIERLESENEKLTKEIYDLKRRLVSQMIDENEDKSEAFNDAMSDLENTISTYKSLIAELCILKSEYKDAVKDVDNIKGKYKKELKKIAKL